MDKFIIMYRTFYKITAKEAHEAATLEQNE